MAVWNTIVPVTIRVREADKPTAISALERRVRYAGFDLYDDSGASYADEREPGVFDVTVTPIALVEASHELEAIVKLTKALSRAGFSPGRGSNAFESEDGVGANLD
jgi:hypothetical protein